MSYGTLFGLVLAEGLVSLTAKTPEVTKLEGHAPRMYHQRSSLEPVH